MNKLNTKAEIRFNVQEADWIPEEVKVRLLQQQGNNMNKVGELVISAQEFRTQKQNKELCLTKLREMVEEAYIEPKDRNMWTGIGEIGKARRREEKKARGNVKDSRRMNKKGFDDFD